MPLEIEIIEVKEGSKPLSVKVTYQVNFGKEKITRMVESAFLNEDAILKEIRANCKNEVMTRFVEDIVAGLRKNLVGKKFDLFST